MELAQDRQENKTQGWSDVEMACGLLYSQFTTDVKGQSKQADAHLPWGKHETGGPSLLPLLSAVSSK